MNKAQIEKLLSNGHYADAYQELKISKPSASRDTYKLECLRALRHTNEAIKLAEELDASLRDNLSGYPVTTSERNNQLRHIALVYAEHKKADKACAIMHALCQKAPKLAALRKEYAVVLMCDGQIDQAKEQLTKALELEPSNADAHARLGNLYCRIGQVDTGYSCYSRAATLQPDNLHYLQRLVYWSNYSERTTQQNNFQLAKLWANRRYPNQTQDLPLLNGKLRNSNPDRRLRVAFISSDLYTHAISFFVVPLLRELDRDSFTVYAYSDTRSKDYVTDLLRDLCAHWTDSVGLSDEQLARQIRDDQIDILIDLSGHTTGCRLGVFAARAAPLQISWLGYPSTTGLSNMDYRITDRIVDPFRSNHSHYSEEPMRLRNGFLCYEPLDAAPDIDATDGGDTIRFGSFNSLDKISTLTLDAWAAAMHVVPNSSLYLKRAQLSSQTARSYFLERFKKRGIDPTRVRLESSSTNLEEHLNAYNQIDIALDTTPYNGTTTALDALWMGVPVVTLKGQTHASRITASILERINLNDLACENISEFCDRIIELSENTETRIELRKNLRSSIRKSALVNGEQFASEFGIALRLVWRRWCLTRSDNIPPQ